VSTIVIGGGDGRRAVTKLVNKYPSMDAEQKAAAVALLQNFVDDVNTLCGNGDHGDDDQGDDNDDQG